jgi:hypothetical protein
MIIIGEIIWIANSAQINNVSQRCNGTDFGGSQYPAVYNMIGNTFGGIPGISAAVPIIEPISGGSSGIQPQFMLMGFYPTSANLDRLKTRWERTTIIANNNNPPNQ